MKLTMKIDATGNPPEQAQQSYTARRDTVITLRLEAVRGEAVTGALKEATKLIDATLKEAYHS